MKLRRIWRTLLWHPLDWAEITSGVTLIALRGAVLKWGPAIYLPPEVSRLLYQVGITEPNWGSYLMLCGLIQIWYAGEERSLGRLLVTIAILAGFVTMTAAFLVTPPGTVNASLICMSAFYTFLLARVMRDRDSATVEGARGHG